MDALMNFGKQALSEYESGQSGGQQQHQQSGGYGAQGGPEYNQPGGQGQPQGVNFDHDEAVTNATQHGSGDRGLFSSAMSFVNSNKQQHTDPVDEDQVQQAHQQAYSQGDAGSLDAGSMGSAAALQALKMFTSGGGGGGGSQTQLISMAMSEASKLFESSGGAASGNKQDAVNGAAMTVMKLLVQSKFSGIIGGGNSGGLGGMSSMLGLASKFM